MELSLTELKKERKIKQWNAHLNAKYGKKTN